ncbi:MAG: hypothetical protein NC319_00015 [Butyricicoccus sp.]|nr:hypothetical protein [Butyricicoccus sp.]
MSYCRFRNTSGDLTDCLDSIRQGHIISRIEAGFGRGMFKRFLTFCRDYDIIDGFDADMVDELFSNLAKEVR